MGKEAKSAVRFLAPHSGAGWPRTPVVACDVTAQDAIAPPMIYLLRSNSIDPYYRGKYLGWLGGRFMPVSNERAAKRYTNQATAQAVATRYNREHRRDLSESPDFGVVVAGTEHPSGDAEGG